MTTEITPPVTPVLENPTNIIEIKKEPPTIDEVLSSIRETVIAKDDDKDQESLVEAVQRSRSFLLDYAMKAYLEKPNSSYMLDSLMAVIAAIEKTVRDDRKERMKKKENEGNVATFNQLLDSLKEMKKGTITVPSFEITNFVLDPTVSLISNPNPGGVPIKAIKPEELVQGVSIVDIDGKNVGSP